MTTTAIWWVRRDFRLFDNPTLHRALQQADQVVPLFVLDETLLYSRYAGEKRIAFMLEGLKRLDQDLRNIGSRLVVRRGNPVAEIWRLREECSADQIFAEEDYSPYARKRDRLVGQEMPLNLVSGLCVYHPTLVTKADGSPYTVYTPFRKRWEGLGPVKRDHLLQSPRHVPTPDNIESVPIPEAPFGPGLVPFQPGELEAERRLFKFVVGPDAGVYRYRDARNRPDIEGTSQLSPYLRWGMLSPRRVAVAAYQAMGDAGSDEHRKHAETWLSELIWREFYISILFHFPDVRTQSFRAEYNSIDWVNDKDQFAAWSTGRTGFPLVDAAMRQLVATGWMHNRCRMVVASLLVKDMLIDWRYGERFFMQHLIDGDPAANNGGWQWTAGTGTDAAPYFRIFSPVTQAQTHDPHGSFIRKWVPELAKVPDAYIHDPARMPSDLQESIGCRIGHDYPAPVVDRTMARQRVLDAYRKAQQTSRR